MPSRLLQVSTCTPLSTSWGGESAASTAYIPITAIVALNRIANTPWHGTESTVTLTSNALMLQSWGFSESIVGPSWSVSTELAAYLLFPLLVGVVLRGRREWIWLSALASLATPLFIATRSSATLHQGTDLGNRHGPLDTWGTHTPFLVLRCLAGFVRGLIGFRLAKHPDVKQRTGRMVAGDLAVASVLLLMLVPGSDVALVLLFVPLTVTLAQQRSWSAALLGSPAVQWFGLISSSLCLVHQPIDHDLRTPLFAWLKAINIPHACNATAVLMSAPIVILAAASYYGIEKPGHTWSRQLFRVGRLPAAGEPAM